MNSRERRLLAFAVSRILTSEQLKQMSEDAHTTSATRGWVCPICYGHARDCRHTVKDMRNAVAVTTAPATDYHGEAVKIADKAIQGAILGQQLEAAHPDYITITHGIRGWFAVQLTWNSEFKGYEPEQSGVGSYPARAGAIPEAKSWAKDLGLEYRP